MKLTRKCGCMNEWNLSTQVRTVISQCALALSRAGIGEEAHDDNAMRAIAEHESILLLAEASKRTISDITAAMFVGKTLGDITDEAHNEMFRDWMCRRIQREPVQHIVGHAPFRFMDVEVGPGVFIPRPETELLIDATLEYVSSLPSHHDGVAESVRIVDLCAGSGVLGLAAATEIPHSEVWAVELSEKAFEYTQRNARSVNPPQYHAVLADATSADTLRELDGTIDIVVSNPPYIPLRDIPEQTEAREYDPDLALYGASEDGMAIPQKIIDRAYALLRSHGLLAMEHDWQQGYTTCEVAKQIGFTHVETRKDFAHKDRFLYALK